MKGAEFLRRVTRHGRRTGTVVRFDTLQGKGSHGTLWFGDRFTTVKDPQEGDRPRPAGQDAS